MLTILILGCNRPENSTRQRCSYGEQSERTSVTMSRKPVGTTLDQKGFPNQSLGGVFWLNAGSALENLLKGIIVQDDPSSIVNGTVTPDLKTHNLLNLAKRASVSVDVQDAFSIYRMQCVMLAGRNPCSNKPNESKPPVFSEADVIAYRSLFERFSSRFADRESNVVALYRLVMSEDFDLA
jgi:hypothetical protein